MTAIDTMSQAEPEEQHSGLNLTDLQFILFRHKWKILLSAVAGIGSAGAIYFLLPFPYESQAKLLVRYVVDHSAVDGMDAAAKTPGSPNEGVIASEVEILTSWDLAIQVVQTIGLDRLRPAGDGYYTEADAARDILKGIHVEPVKGSNIISVSYQNKDPKLASEVLDELVNRYFDKHLEVHRSGGAFAFVSRETEQLRSQLTKTEAALKELKAKAGITSLAEDSSTMVSDLAKARDELESAQAELVSQQARVKEFEQLLTGAQISNEISTVTVSGEIVRDYQSLLARLTQLQQGQTELLSRYTPQNALVKIKQTQIDELENQRHGMERRYPGLIAAASVAGSSQGPRPDLVSEKARLKASEARVDALRSQLSDLQRRAVSFSEAKPQIEQLERTRDVEETNLKYYEASLEKARIDETLDPSRMPNISIVQKPSPAERAKRDIKKILLGLVGGGLVAGLGVALAIELVFNRTVKRPQELETRLRIPLMLSIPHLSLNGRSRQHLNDGSEAVDLLLQDKSNGHSLVTHSSDPLAPFCDALRDRLVLYFDFHRIGQKPKLVALTGLSRSAGVSTLASGLAASLSDASEGKILLVDKPPAAKRVYDLIQEYRASQFDYIIFDMPSLGDTSVTLPMAGFMDKVLLVIEAEKSSLDGVKRAYAQLTAKTKVSVVFNKNRACGPRWIKGDL